MHLNLQKQLIGAGQLSNHRKGGEGRGEESEEIGGVFLKAPKSMNLGLFDPLS